MMQFIGEDEVFFKTVISMQIQNSADLFQEILTSINELEIEPKRVLELGGANGWATDYLKKYVFSELEMAVVVDSFPAWTPIAKDIDLVALDYFSYNPEVKFDFIFSILGYSTRNHSAFVEKAISVLEDGGYLILALRIATDEMYEYVENTATSLGCELVPEGCKKVESGTFFTEIFPVITIRKGEEMKTWK